MKVLLAGATGAIGRPLLRALISAGHEVLCLARSDGAAESIVAAGGIPVRADAMDRDGLLRAVGGLSAAAVIHQLTALKSPKLRLTESDPSTALRVKGTAHLLAAAQVLGASRFLTQSLVTGYGYHDHGRLPLTEEDPFGVLSGTKADIVVKGLKSTEDQVFSADGIEGIALRYGILYGPGTWFDPAPGTKGIPVPSSGGGLMSWVHVDDAARGTVAALHHGLPGQAYNLVDGSPMTWGEKAAQVGNDRRVPARLLRLIPYLGALMLDTSMRVSHARATSELNWQPGRR